MKTTVFLVTSDTKAELFDGSPINLETGDLLILAGSRYMVDIWTLYRRHYGKVLGEIDIIKTEDILLHQDILDNNGITATYGDS